MTAAARAIVRSATASTRGVPARLSASIFRSPLETNSIGEASISPHRGLFGKVDGRNHSTFSAKTRRFRFQRRIDLKRSTAATGIVERIEYDPNRNARIALVRWEGDSLQRKCNTPEELILPEKKLESTTAAASGTFALSSLPGLVDGINFPYFSNEADKQKMKSKYVTVGAPAGKSSSSKSDWAVKTSAKDVIASAFSPKAKGENSGVSVGYPRIAVAGSRPAFFVLGEKEEIGERNTFALGELQRWKKDSPRWAHRLRRKGAVSWQSMMRQELGSGKKVSNATKAKSGKCGDDRVPVAYIIASHQLEKGSLVINWTESTDGASRTAQNYYSY